MAYDSLHGVELRYLDINSQQVITYDMVPGPNYGSLTELQFVGTKCYFTGWTDLSENTLRWIDFTDDSPQVHELEINPFGDASPSDLTLIGSRQYFFAEDGIIGQELRWIDTLSDTQTVNTVADVAEGVESVLGNWNAQVKKVDGTSLYFIASRLGFGGELYRLDVSGSFDRDTDFDANDSFLTQLVMLSGSDAQIEQTKGASRSTVQQIRTRIEAMGDMADVDGDGDFDANDSFLIHLLQLSAADSQIELSKGASPLSAAEIRMRFQQLGQFTHRSTDNGAGTQQLVISKSVQTTPPVPIWPATPDRIEMFSDDQSFAPALMTGSAETVIAVDDVMNDKEYRAWIDALG